MSGNLNFFAGKKAFSLIRGEGLDFKKVKVMAGAGGGPKWLVLYGIDRVICSDFLKNRKDPLFLIGSSIGSWRFAAYGHKDPVKALERFRLVYTGQHYSEKPDAEEISNETLRIMREYLRDAGVKEILSNPVVRLNALSSRCRGLSANENKLLLSMGIAVSFLINMLSRGLLGLFFNRTLFYDSRDIPPFYNMKGFNLSRVPITEKNLQSALMASGSIPLIMNGVRDISGAQKGVYRDGAIIDYHLDIPFLNEGDGLALYPHFSERIIPGWFDKMLKWRKPSDENFSNVLLICPSRDFVNRLPYKKIPDRSDFKNFSGADKERILYWEKTADQSRILGEEFYEAVMSGKIKELVKPFNL